MRILLCALSTLFVLAACGEKDAYIADKVKFKVIFSQKIVQVSFDINKKYEIKTAKKISFDQLGAVFLKWTDSPELSEIGSQLRGDLGQSTWPTDIIQTFPNGKSLPISVPSSSVNRWIKSDDNLQFDLLFQHQPQLVNGGALISQQFNGMPKNFLATQKFYAKNGDVQASISALGPSSSNSGGIYFFGNFGVNPFANSITSPSDRASENIEDVSDPNDVMEWELPATTPADIISSGSIFSTFAWWENPQALVDQLTLDIDNFNSK